MSFISYAQNNEDVLLWRALGHIAPEDGFYIDVGASDPVEHSVTRAFYDAGWRGINIEPLPRHAAAFAEQRPRDVNLAVAAGSVEGSLTLYDVPAVRGWASPDPAVAALHRAEGHAVTELTVPVRTLAAICAEHVTGPVHFLKIDVEGFEGEVLRGIDFARWRPWVLVIEATLPNSRVSSHAAWEHMVTGQDYRFAWFDGLNRYYVAAEYADLLRHFDVQPNVFDDAISYHLDRAWTALRRSGAALRDGDGKLQALQGQLDGALARVDALEHERQTAQADAERARAEAAQAGSAADAARTAAAQARAAAAVASAATGEARAAAARARLEAASAQAEAARAVTDAAAARAVATAAQAGTADARTAAARACSEAARARADSLRARAATVRADAEIVQAHSEIARMHGEYDRAVANGRQVAAWAQDLEQRLLATLASTSWRVTQPLRDAGAFVQRLRRPGLVRRALIHTLAGMGASERMRRIVIPLLLRHPALGRRVSGLLQVLRPAPPLAAATAEVPEDLRDLPASVRAVLLDLRRSQEQTREQNRAQVRDDEPCAS